MASRVLFNRHKRKVIWWEGFAIIAGYLYEMMPNRGRIITFWASIFSILGDEASFYYDLTVIFQSFPLRQSTFNVDYTLLVEHMISGFLSTIGFWQWKWETVNWHVDLVLYWWVDVHVRYCGMLIRNWSDPPSPLSWQPLASLVMRYYSRRVLMDDPKSVWHYWCAL